MTDSDEDMLAMLPTDRRERLATAADTLFSVLSEAVNEGRHFLLDLIGEVPFAQWSHYPAEDVHDTDTGALFFYHAHAPEDRGADEHGHFHCFVERSRLLAPDAPLARPDADASGRQLCHLVAISMDHRGVPVELFTTNQWVTDEWLYPADAVIPLIDRFAFSDPGAASLAARWLAAFIALHQPVIARLLQERDAALEIGTGGGAGKWGDPDLEVPSRRPVDIDGWITAVREARQDR